ncbi:glycerophosphodiester phosphodiesterase [Maribellus sediminis]|uniref:glycerophosphodiester phosphodiesterase n=1 Tax=Maribellus sediminis TaxID=2696285 RepID=UPI001431FA13|nr:glycerophosphodiester phosphodiesterase family protein [Maribellus sediminis]
MKTIVISFIITLLASSLIAQNTFIAHRGASYLAPENTVASAKLAWELGADAVEVDVHLTKDNRVIVIHDKDTKRTCSGKKNLVIAKAPSVLLRDLDAGVWKGKEFKGEKLPYLGEIIETVPEGKTLVVEIKAGGEEIIPALRRVIDKSGKIDQIVFISFGWETIINTHREFPDNKCYWLSSVKQGLNRKMEESAELGLTGVNLKYSIIDEAVMDEAKKLNLEVLSWTIDEPAEAKRLTAIGVKGITTNRPKWLKEEMSKL